MIPQFEIIPSEGAPIKAWKQGVPFDEKAIKQLQETAMLPFIYKWVAAMPDTHWGMEAQRDLVEPIHKLKQILCVKGK